jgi:agmatine/peptidylarginine deiminase
MLWPHRLYVWRKDAAPAREAFTAVIKAIAKFEPVEIGVRPDDIEILTGEWREKHEATRYSINLGVTATYELIDIACYVSFSTCPPSY